MIKLFRNKVKYDLIWVTFFMLFLSMVIAAIIIMGIGIYCLFTLI